MQTADRTSTLITADKVQGAPVYNAAGESLGSIDDIVIDRKTGNVAYAVMSFGGFLGFGTRYYPLPWLTLKYDPKLDGYVTSARGRRSTFRGPIVVRCFRSLQTRGDPFRRASHAHLRRRLSDARHLF